ncbi:DUF1327 domain-containing protein [Escherichia coli]|nr:DUF1327 domain-containing protein [Escherichia coli]EIV8254927.1 DUF1327 domain-containing protein [Escherichia coli]ELN0302912.1 DUF1327 domain-containing protein [Escherichia coli]ELS9531607.1 DUF1327 domain-containing protein [Escherichia coli]GDS09691.1 hypothetical protein BvCmsOUP006_03515 [Escherichia coli]
MNKQYELVVKGINNYPDKITVTVALETGGYTSLLLPNVVIDLDRVEGAPLEFYEAEAKKKAKQFFMDIAAGLCEGNEPLLEKRLCSEERYTIQINNAYNTIQSEKDDIESRIEKLENSVVELNKKLSVQIPSEGEKIRRDEQFAAFYDYCRKVMSRNLAECFSIHNDNFSELEWECNRPSFVVSGDGGKITISENGKVTPPSHQHSEELIEFAIDYLKNNKKQGLMQRIGRCMGYLQVAAEIEALASGADKDSVVREALLRDFDNPPFKKVPAYWLHPGLTYLKVRI